MHRNYFRATVLFAVLFFLSGAITVLASRGELDRVGEEIDQLEQQRENSRQELSGLQQEKEYLDGELAEWNKKMSQAVQALNELEGQLSQKEQEISVTQEALSQAQEEEARQYEDMKLRIRFMYERGNESFLSVLLTSGSVGELLNYSSYVENIYSYDRQRLLEYQNTKAWIAEKEEQLNTEREILLTLQEEQLEWMEETENLMAQMTQKLRVTGNKIADVEQEIASYDARIAEQEKYEEELERQKAQEDEKRLEEIQRQEQEELPPLVLEQTSDDLSMLAAIIQCEADGESYEGKLAVGSVVLNRVRSSAYPNTVMGVIYQSGQFSPVASGRFATVLSQGANAECVQAARENLSGMITVDVLHFCRNTDAISGMVIGNHVFY